MRLSPRLRRRRRRNPPTALHPRPPGHPPCLLHLGRPSPKHTRHQVWRLPRDLQGEVPPCLLRRDHRNPHRASRQHTSVHHLSLQGRTLFSALEGLKAPCRTDRPRHPHRPGLPRLQRTQLSQRSPHARCFCSLVDHLWTGLVSLAATQICAMFQHRHRISRSLHLCSRNRRAGRARMRGWQ
jgi:hypothetical protein